LSPFLKIKVWCHYATLFEIFYFFNIHSYNTITLRSSFTIRRGPSFLKIDLQENIPALISILADESACGRENFSSHGGGQGLKDIRERRNFLLQHKSRPTNTNSFADWGVAQDTEIAAISL
jgi:hypothetical protein